MTPETAAGYAQSCCSRSSTPRRSPKAEMEPDELGVHGARRTANARDHAQSGPTPYFLELLTHQTALPLHQASVEETMADQFTRPRQHGHQRAPTCWKAFTPNDRIVMARQRGIFQRSRQRADRADRIQPRSRIARPACAGSRPARCTSVPTFRTEQMDYIARDAGRTSCASPPILGTFYLPVKTTNEGPLSDPRVRQAISMVIGPRVHGRRRSGRETMIPAYSFVPPASPTTSRAFPVGLLPTMDNCLGSARIQEPFALLEGGRASSPGHLSRSKACA